MRQLTVEFSKDVVLGKYGGVNPFDKVNRLEVLHFLQLNKEVAMIARVEFKDPKTRMQDLFSDQKGDFHVLNSCRGKKRV